MSATLTRGRCGVDLRLCFHRCPPLLHSYRPRPSPDRCFQRQIQPYYTNPPRGQPPPFTNPLYPPHQAPSPGSISHGVGPTDPLPVYFPEPAPEPPKRKRRIFWAVLRYGCYISMGLLGAATGYLTFEPFQTTLDLRRRWERQLFGLQEMRVEFLAERAGFGDEGGGTGPFNDAYVTQAFDQLPMERLLISKGFPPEQSRQIAEQAEAQKKELRDRNLCDRAGYDTEEVRERVRAFHRDLDEIYDQESYYDLLGGPRGIGPSRWYRIPQNEDAYETATMFIFLGDRVCGWPGVVHGGVIATLARELAATIFPPIFPMPMDMCPVSVVVNYKKLVRADSSYVCTARLLQVPFETVDGRAPPFVIDFKIETVTGQLCAEAQLKYDLGSALTANRAFRRWMAVEHAQFSREHNHNLDIFERDLKALEKLPLEEPDEASEQDPPNKPESETNEG